MLISFLKHLEEAAEDDGITNIQFNRLILEATLGFKPKTPEERNNKINELTRSALSYADVDDHNPSKQSN